MLNFTPLPKSQVHPYLNSDEERLQKEKSDEKLFDSAAFNDIVGPIVVNRRWLTFTLHTEQLCFDRVSASKVNAIKLSSVLVLLVLVTIAALAKCLQEKLAWYHVAPRFLRILVDLIGLLSVYTAKDNGVSILGFRIQHVTLGNIVIVGGACFSGWILISHVMVGECIDRRSVVCNSLADDGLMPMYSVWSSILVLVVYPFFLKNHRWWAVVLAYCITLACAITACVLGDLYSPSNLVALGVFAFLFILIHEYELNNIKAYVVLVNLEMTLRSRLAAENEKELMAMQSKELRHLIGNVAHDLKTPVQGFLMELDNLEAATSIQSKKSSVRSLRSTCSFMTMMINRAIDYTKANAGMALIPSMETVDISSTIKWVKYCVGKSPSGVPVLIHTFDARIHNFVITDKQWLMENLLCLLSNAMKFSTEGEIVVRCRLVPSAFDKTESLSNGLVSEMGNVRRLSSKTCRTNTNKSDFSRLEYSVSFDDDKSMVRFEVEDTGVGIPEEERNEIFQLFQQSQRRAGGTGLGLYSLSKRIESIGGEFGVCGRSDGNSGSCFWFTIPYRPNMTKNLAQLCSAEENVAELISSNDVAPDLMLRVNGTYHNFESGVCNEQSGALVRENLSRSCVVESDEPHESIESLATDVNDQHCASTRILVVDDSILIQKTTSRALQRIGFVVDVAVNGVHCLNMLYKENKTYDIILMDLQMPVLDGIETVKRIRKHDSSSGHQRRFIVGLSANSDIETVQEAMAAGMDSFIAKPLTVELLRNCCAQEHIMLRNSTSVYGTKF